MRFTDLYQDPVYPAPGCCSRVVPDRLALPRFRPDHCVSAHGPEVRLQFDPALETVDDALDIGVALTCGILQPAEVRRVSALPQIDDAGFASIPERLFLGHQLHLKVHQRLFIAARGAELIAARGSDAERIFLAMLCTPAVWGRVALV